VPSKDTYLRLATTSFIPRVGSTSLYSRHRACHLAKLRKNTGTALGGKTINP